MKAVNFWKTLFCAALAVTAFTACSDDDDDGYKGMAEISVNGGESVTVSRDLTAGETSPVVEVVSKGDWVLEFDTKSDASWCTPTLLKGKTGTTKLSFNLSAASADRTATITLTATGYFEGVPIPKKATIKVVQSSGSIPTDEPLYSENCGTKVEKVDGNWPYVDKFEGWTRGGSLDQAGVTYEGSSSSVRNSGNAYEPSDNEKSEVSGAPYVFINSTSARFDIVNINIASNTNFTFTFTALDQKEYSGGPVFADIDASTIKVSVSTDGGTSYSPVALTAQKIGTGNWSLCTAMFKLPASVSTDKISVRFDKYPATGSDVPGHQGLRIDDFKLYEGGSGQELGGGETPEPENATISQITAIGDYKVTGAKVVAVSTRSFVMSDNTGSFLVYRGSDNVPAIGDVIDVEGTVESYGGMLQFGAEATVSKTGTTQITAPSATEVTAANIQSIIDAKKVVYVKMGGELVKSGNFYNLNFNFQDSHTGAIDSPIASLNIDSFVDQQVSVEGWFIYTTGSGARFTVVATKITGDSSAEVLKFTSTPGTFAAENPVEQTITFEAQNVGNVTFALSGANADKFEVKSQTDKSVVVAAKGNNTEKTAYTATLTATAGAKSDAVELKQAAPTSGAGYTKIEKIADLKAGTGYLAGFAKEKYQTWTGVLSGSQCETVPYSYTEATGAFVADDAAAAEISLVAVDGVANAYYIKYGEKYLTVSAAGKNKLSLVDAAGDNYWTFTNDEANGMKATAKAFDSIMMTSTGASSKFIRSYVSTTTSGVEGVVFFLAK